MWYVKSANRSFPRGSPGTVNGAQVQAIGRGPPPPCELKVRKNSLELGPPISEVPVRRHLAATTPHETIRTPRIAETRHHTSISTRSTSKALEQSRGTPSHSKVVQTKKDVGRFLPKLIRILEASGSDHGAQRRTITSSSTRQPAESSLRMKAISTERRRRSIHNTLYNRASTNLNSASLLSIISNLTGTAGSSSGSNSTVTQNSYARSRGSGHNGLLKNRRQSTNRESHAKRHRVSRTVATEPINVFNYMETDSVDDPYSSAWLSSSLSSSSLSATETASDTGSSYTTATSVERSPHGSPVFTKRKRRPSAFANQEQLRSDSGISMRDDTTESVGGASTVYQRPSVEPVTTDGQRFIALNNAQHLTSTGSGSNGRLVSSERPPDGSPISYKSSLIPNQMIGNPPPHTQQAPNKLLRVSEVGHNRAIVRHGYDLLASSLSAWRPTSKRSTSFLIPIYRRFEALDHRVLLFLQDELSELEEQLQSLDAWVAEISRDRDREIVPACRRSEIRYGGQAHMQRNELLGRIFVKNNQYKEALSLYRTTNKDLESPTLEEVEAYRTWLRENKPIAEAETRFLNCTADLVRIVTPVAKPERNPNAAFLCWTIIGPLAGLVLLHIALSAAGTTLLGRFFVLAIAAGAVSPCVAALIARE